MFILFLDKIKGGAHGKAYDDCIVLRIIYWTNNDVFLAVIDGKNYATIHIYKIAK